MWQVCKNLKKPSKCVQAHVGGEVDTRRMQCEDGLLAATAAEQEHNGGQQLLLRQCRNHLEGTHECLCADTCR